MGKKKSLLGVLSGQKVPEGKQKEVDYLCGWCSFNKKRIFVDR